METLPRLSRATIRQLLDEFDLQPLFIEELGWDHGGIDTTVIVADKTFTLKAIAHKRGFVAYQCVSGRTRLPDYRTRQKIDRILAKTSHEHLIVFTTTTHSAQCWQWVKRESSQRDRYRQQTYSPGQSAEALTEKLEHLRFSLAEEERVSIADATLRVAKAFDVEKVTKRFYDRFRTEHQVFLGFIKGIREVANREWYASLMLNRMMFIYFIQKRSFLDNDPDYLRNRLARVAKTRGSGQFHSFYRQFLRCLFRDGLGTPEADRKPELAKLLGRIPYLNGGLFDVHDLERDNPNIDIPDRAFKQIFDFFDAYQWHLDDRPLRDDNEINPDVLGYIFEKYVNQKQMGAYYTKEDITGYVSRNTIVPRLFDQAKKDCAIAFKPGQGVWRLLAEDPDSYIYPSVRHGISLDMYAEGNGELAKRRPLPKEIAAGLDDVAQRTEWNKAAPREYALPTETWREHIARRHHYEEVREKLAAGEIASVNDLVTYNLDVEAFARNAIRHSEGPELVRAFWKAIRNISILDPTVGSGAFLFAALNVLEPLYNACLDAMRGLLDDLDHSQRKHRPEKMSDFRQVLKEMEQHPSERYFVLKSIVINNLYGVDIMEEAVEICKLRLFLKLVAQVETYDQIEPLPDMDFNVRPGNTLVGFTSMDEVKKTLSEDVLKRANLPQVEERAEFADRAFRQFQAMQRRAILDASEFSSAKVTLRQRLDDLRTELDRYLAEDYGVRTARAGEYRKWRRSHQPFHWFIEFHEIIQRGGFDVIIGNPPYLEVGKVPYKPSFAPQAGATVHGNCVERSIALGGSANMSMILPMSLVSTQRMRSLQRLLEVGRDCWYSNFAWRPGKLFDAVNRALSIFVTARPHNDGVTFTTGYRKWNSGGRDHLVPALKYVRCDRERGGFWVPKLNDGLETSILRKVQAVGRPMQELAAQGSSAMSKARATVYYRTTGGLYWKVFTDFAPEFVLNGVPGKSSRETTFAVPQKKHAPAAIATLSSSLFWWWYTVTSNLRDLNPIDWQLFPVPPSALEDRDVARLGRRYINDLKRNSEMLVRRQKDTGLTETQSFKVSKSKPIIDQIDMALAAHYGFTAEESDFIINYDIKYRMGAEL